MLVSPSRIRSLILSLAIAASYVYAPAGVALILLSLLVTSADAQVGSSTDILTGIVQAPDGRPLEGATIEATSVETNITRRARSGSNGRYTIVFPDGGGQYRMRAIFLGMAPQEFVSCDGRRGSPGARRAHVAHRRLDRRDDRARATTTTRRG